MYLWYRFRKKQQLTGASGLQGYRIKEIGTLIMRPDLYTQYPMVYGSNKLGGGKHMVSSTADSAIRSSEE